MLELSLVEDAMRRALTIARRGPARDQNPQVGCVLVAPDGRIVAEGWHRGAGTPHAETDALEQLSDAWRVKAHELTAVVTLEPCNHTGYTGPCAEALIAAKIGSVVFALADPGETSAGGAKTLTDAGITVREGVLVAEARARIEPWLRQQGAASADPPPHQSTRSAQTTQAAPHARPHVTVKWAQTIDGRAAAADGSSQWITGPEARADVHRRRAEADAILVGTGTLYADDPALTARDSSGDLLVPEHEQPLPVVLGHRAIPATARLREHPALAARGLSEAIQLGGDDLTADLAALHAQGVQRLFVEGGPAVASSFIAAGLVDDALIYIAPALLGGARLALGDIGIDSIDGIERLQVVSVEQLGDDLLVRAAFAGGFADQGVDRHALPGSTQIPGLTQSYGSTQPPRLPRHGATEEAR